MKEQNIKSAWWSVLIFIYVIAAYMLGVKFLNGRDMNGMCAWRYGEGKNAERVVKECNMINQDRMIEANIILGAKAITAPAWAPIALIGGIIRK
jgi:hypothetical protein